MTAAQERRLHEDAAIYDRHSDQTRGVVGWFYSHYRTAALRRIDACRGLVLEVGAGEGVIAVNHPRVVQLDCTALRLVRSLGPLRVCADGYELPFPDKTFDLVLLLAVLEHTRQPQQILRESMRVLKPGGEALVVVPNDFWMSLGRVLLGKWPPRYPDHLYFFTPRRLRAMAVSLSCPIQLWSMPWPRLGFWLNMYLFGVIKR